MRSVKLTLDLTLTVLFMLGVAVITFEAKASGDPPQINLPPQNTLGSTEVQDIYTPQHLASTTAVTRSKLVATQCQ